jgi:hypothetical protein
MRSSPDILELLGTLPLQSSKAKRRLLADLPSPTLRLILKPFKSISASGKLVLPPFHLKLSRLRF